MAVIVKNEWPRQPFHHSDSRFGFTARTGSACSDLAGLGRVIQSDENRRQDLILWPAAKESLSHRQDMRLGRAIGRDRQGANRSHDSDPGPIA